MYKIGIDIGGMSIKAGLVDNGEIIDRLAKETDIQGGLDKLVEKKIVSDTVLWKQKKYNANHIRSLLIKYSKTL